MFGMTLLTIEEKKEHIRVKRIHELQNLINKEGVVRSTSLIKAESYTAELEVLLNTTGVVE
jgi:hypothetical protein|tara:strand:- start:37 stop:219 length:183 start_codon:yes stop_codon:yes gene_type:complete